MPPSPLRVGLIKGNLEYLDEFERAEHGPNVFDVHQVRDAMKLCVRIHSGLSNIGTRSLQPPSQMRKRPTILSGLNRNPDLDGAQGLSVLF